MNQQKDGDSPVRMIVPGLLEKCRRKTMDGLRGCLLQSTKYAAVQIGVLQKEARSKKVVKPKFTKDFLGAVVWEGAGVLTLRAHEEGILRTLIDTTNTARG